MPRRYELGPHAIGVVKQLAELEPVVALHARIWRPAARVFIDEVIDDLLELGLQIQGVKWNVEAIGHATGVLGIAGRAAALLVVSTGVEDRQLKARRAVRRAGLLGLLAMPHEHTDDLMPLLLEQPGGDARINAAGHS